MIGFVNVNKPSGIGSSKVVAILKKQFNIKKIGHMGTLDPLAEGVLPIAIGKATRMFDYFLEKRKTYIAEFTFGATTDTLDSEGEITETTLVIPTKQQILDILPNLIGEIDQIPPQYSAKKVNGKCAYDFARQGEIVELNPKRITIYNIDLISGDGNKYKFEIECSGGTYIRSIARDMAQLLHSKAYMSRLIRTKSGSFNIDKAYYLDELKQLSLSEVLCGIEEIFDFPIIKLDNSTTKNLLDGKIVKVNENSGQFFIKCDNILIGIGHVDDNILKLKTYLKED